MADVALITGFPRLLARGLAQRTLNLDPDSRVLLLVEEADAEAAERFVAALTGERGPRVEVLLGRLNAVDLGLSGAEVKRLLGEVTLIFHSAHAAEARNLRRENLRRLNAVLGLAREMSDLRRVAVFSTAFVSGDRSGTIYEEELDAGQRLRTPFEASMFAVERLARELMPRLPITVLRPSAMIGHSRTGDASGLTEGPHYLMSLMVRLPSELPFLLPGSGVVPFNIVPIDYVVQAACALAQAPEAAGRTFHLTDPNPVSARQAFELLSNHANRAAPFVGRVVSRALKRALRVTGLGRLSPDQMALLEDLTTHVTYHCGGTLEILSHTDVACPSFESYADALITWLAEYERTTRRPAAAG
ncbi:MAG: SDR family oxidoreductase [Myxococcales bacterium]|nr:SDR family oxidoreductase [Myxococcales bacterium]